MRSDKYLMFSIILSPNHLFLSKKSSCFVLFHWSCQPFAGCSNPSLISDPFVSLDLVSENLVYFHVSCETHMQGHISYEFSYEFIFQKTLFQLEQLMLLWLLFWLTMKKAVVTVIVLNNHERNNNNLNKFGSYRFNPTPKKFGSLELDLIFFRIGYGLG